MKNYIVISSEEIDRLGESINDKIKEGYIPSGGITAVERNIPFNEIGGFRRATLFVQAMF